jgi:hypothetical protein
MHFGYYAFKCHLGSEAPTHCLQKFFSSQTEFFFKRMRHSISPSSMVAAPHRDIYTNPNLISTVYLLYPALEALRKLDPAPFGDELGGVDGGVSRA